MSRPLFALVPIALVLGLGPTAAAWPGPERWPQRGPPEQVRWYRDEAPAANPRVDIDWRALEADVLREMNLFRKNPRAYADKLVALRAQMRGTLIERPGLAPVATREGVAAVDEAIGVLRRGPRRLPRLAPSSGLERAAADHARDLGNNDGLGHDGSDGSTPEDRIARHGRWDVMVAENIAFGPTTGEEVIVGLLVDDGVPDRGHRDVLFERDLFFTGVSCGPHPSYGATCVIDYAGAFESYGSGRGPAERADRFEATSDDGEEVDAPDEEPAAEDAAEPQGCPLVTPSSRWRTTPGP